MCHVLTKEIRFAIKSLLHCLASDHNVYLVTLLRLEIFLMYMYTCNSSQLVLNSEIAIIILKFLACPIDSECTTQFPLPATEKSLIFL